MSNTSPMSDQASEMAAELQQAFAAERKRRQRTLGALLMRDPRNPAPPVTNIRFLRCICFPDHLLFSGGEDVVFRMI